MQENIQNVSKIQAESSLQEGEVMSEPEKASQKQQIGQVPKDQQIQIDETEISAKSHTNLKQMQIENSNQSSQQSALVQKDDQKKSTQTKDKHKKTEIQEKDAKSHQNQSQSKEQKTSGDKKEKAKETSQEDDKKSQQDADQEKEKKKKKSSSKEKEQQSTSKQAQESGKQKKEKSEVPKNDQPAQKQDTNAVSNKKGDVVSHREKQEEDKKQKKQSQSRSRSASGKQKKDNKRKSKSKEKEKEKQKQRQKQKQKQKKKEVIKSNSDNLNKTYSCSTKNKHSKDERSRDKSSKRDQKAQHKRSSSSRSSESNSSRSSSKVKDKNDQRHYKNKNNHKQEEITLYQPKGREKEKNEKNQEKDKKNQSDSKQGQQASEIDRKSKKSDKDDDNDDDDFEIQLLLGKNEDEELEKRRQQRLQLLKSFSSNSQADKQKKDIPPNQSTIIVNQEIDRTASQGEDVPEKGDKLKKNVVSEDDDEEDENGPFVAKKASVDQGKQNELRMLELLRDKEAEEMEHFLQQENEQGENISKKQAPSIKTSSSPRKKKQKNSMMIEEGKGDGEEDEKSNKGSGNGEDQEEEEDEEFDMFAEISLSELQKQLEKQQSKAHTILDSEVQHDAEFYYKIRVGELMNNNVYQVVARLGKGVYANCAKAMNTKTHEEVAIKILRNQEITLRAGEREQCLLEQLNNNDKHDKKHVIRIKDSFQHQKHLCLVFELMDMNLRQCFKIYGKNKGLSLQVVRSYGMQLFVSLTHLQKNKIVHADIQPDNILISKDTQTVKLCDFGTAFPVEECSVVEYLVSRYYRAPEIIIGCPYDCSIDMWSMAVTLFELYTGQFLFTGRNNNEILKRILQTKGKFNNKMLKKGVFVEKYFDSQTNFLSKEMDPITKNQFTKLIQIGDQPTRDLASLLLAKQGVINDDEKKRLIQFQDLLDKCLALDPQNRLTPEEALLHPFINIKATLQKE